MRAILPLVLALALLAACVEVPPGQGPAGDLAATPKSDDTQANRASEGASTTPVPESTEAPGGLTPIVVTSLPPSTVVLSEIKTPTPEPPPPTGADVTIGMESFGKTVDLTVGQTLAVALDVRDWLTPTYDLEILAPQPWVETVPSNMKIWLVKAIGAGTTLFSVQTANPPCPPPNGGPCSLRPVFLYEVTVKVSP